MSGWPFWAATSTERIGRTFDLAAVGAGEHLVDLGCGDGRVLLQAAQQRQARVTGVELDPELATKARRLLQDNGVPGTIIEADFSDVDIEADVVFAYLSPATLQRLSARLAGLAPGTRVVTAGYAVPGWVPAAAAGGCYLYRLPVAVHEVDRSRHGWANPGMLVSLRPGAATLVAAKLHHAGGPVGVHVSGDLSVVATARPGADAAEAGDEVVFDLRFQPLEEASLVEGCIEVPGGPALRVFAAVDAGQPGVWGLNDSGCEDVAAALAAGRMTPVLETARRLGDPRPTPRLHRR